MNYTILSLISSSILTNAPAFVYNNYSFTHCHFNKFYPVLFYNNHFGLNVKDSTFSQGIKGIVVANNPIIDGQHYTYSDKYETSFDSESNTDIKDLKNISITFNGCLFINIGTLQSSHPFRIIKEDFSVYITRSTFANCKSTEGVLILKGCRCVTITHVCSYNSRGHGSQAFLLMDCKKTDFFIFLFSTIVTDSAEGDARVNVFCKYGDQYFRCINMTNFLSDGSVGIQFDNSQCFSFGMCNVMNCKGYSFEITGNDADNSYSMEKINVMTNTWRKMFRIQSQKKISCTIYDSVLINSGGQMFEKDGDVSLKIENCFYHISGDVSPVEIGNGCTLVDNNADHIMTFQMFINETYCQGVKYNDEIIKGCNIEDCVNNHDVCNRTIGFPEGVVSYPTFIDTKMQTDFFTPSKTFMPTNAFTASYNFSASNAFTRSKSFTKSNSFSASKSFSYSSSFSSSSSFTNSKEFTESKSFTKSKSFTSSHFFTQSMKFSSSMHFSFSHSFSNSNVFSSSHFFTFSSKFSKSELFTKSKQFSSSFYFTYSQQFSKTGYFSETIGFSKSYLFTNSFNFSESDPFSESRHFDATKTFTPSNKFSKSTEFSSSFGFTQSNNFNATRNFAPSNNFTASFIFTNSFYFTYSLYFIETTRFSESKEFSHSTKFTKSDHFTKSSNFTSSDDFTKTNNFDVIKSSELTKSDVFTKSNKFDATKLFTASSSFIKSKEFTKSSHFSVSDNFTPSQTFKNKVVIVVKENKNKNKAAIIGGVVAAILSAIGIAAAITAFIILRHRHLEQGSDMFEELNPIDSISSTITYNNVLHGFDMNDDPFEDDFH